jgi:hypothetical protein
MVDLLNNVNNSRIAKGMSSGAAHPPWMLLSVAVIIVAAIAAVWIFVSYGGQASQPGTQQYPNDSIAAAFASGTLNGSALTNIMSQGLRNNTKLNITSIGNYLNTYNGGSSGPTSTYNEFTTNFLKSGNDIRMTESTASTILPQNITTKENLVSILVGNKTEYVCREPVPSPPNNYTCVSSPVSNSNTLLNLSYSFSPNQNGLKFKFIGMRQRIGIPCDMIIGNGIVTYGNGQNQIQANIGLAECISFTYYTMLNDTESIIWSDNQLSAINIVATSVNRNVPANITTVP